MRNVACLAGIAVIVICVAINQSSADPVTVFSCDFESPKYEVDHGVIGRPSGAHPYWNLQYNLDANVVIDPAGGTNQVGAWVQEGASGHTDVAVGDAWSEPPDHDLWPPAVSGSLPVEFSFRIYCPSTTLTGYSLLMGHEGSDPNGNNNGLGMYVKTVDDGLGGVALQLGAKRYNVNESATSWSGALTLNEWHTARVVVTFGAGTGTDGLTDAFDFTVDTVLVGDNLDILLDKQLSEYNPFVTGGLAGDKVYLDDILIAETVPEPATLGFLAIGGLGMIGAAIRRRRGC